MCVFLISPVPIAEPLTSELIDTPVFYNLAPRPIKYRVSVPIPTSNINRAYVARAELIHVSDRASDLGIAKMHHRQEFEYYCI